MNNPGGAFDLSKFRQSQVQAVPAVLLGSRKQVKMLPTGQIHPDSFMDGQDLLEAFRLIIREELRAMAQEYETENEPDIPEVDIPEPDSSYHAKEPDYSYYEESNNEA